MDVKNRLKTNWSLPAESRFLRVPIFADQCQDVRGSYVFRVRVKYDSSHWETLWASGPSIVRHHFSPSSLTSPHKLESFTNRLDFIYTHPYGKKPLVNPLKTNMSGDWISVTFIPSQSDFKKLRQTERLHESRVPAVISVWFCRVLPRRCHFIATVQSE